MIYEEVIKMRKKVKDLKNNKIAWIITAVLAIALCFVILKLYFNKLDREEKELNNKTDLIYVTKNNEINDNGLYVANLKEELKEFIEDKTVKTITYKFEGEDFYLELGVEESEDDEQNFTITRIVNPDFGINAQLNMRNIESIEYRTSNLQKASVFRITQKYNVDYFAMAEDVYYFLGQDIESISFMDDHFYYVSFNPNYLSLKTARECSKEVKKDIDGFDMNDYYYKYGKINFLRDYYQKLATKKYTVQNKCNELTKALENEEEN